jgi:hypothetical protein
LPPDEPFLPERIESSNSDHAIAPNEDGNNATQGEDPIRDRNQTSIPIAAVTCKDARLDADTSLISKTPPRT